MAQLHRTGVEYKAPEWVVKSQGLEWWILHTCVDFICVDFIQFLTSFSTSAAASAASATAAPTASAASATAAPAASTASAAAAASASVAYTLAICGRFEPFRPFGPFRLLQTRGETEKDAPT